MDYKNDVTKLIGNTPIVKLNILKEKLKLYGNIFAKIEMFNPGGSVKDRVALSLIEDGEKKELLKPGMTIIESTSGNTGIGLALVSAIKGYKLVIVMPDTASIERVKLMKAYGAEVILTPGNLGMDGAIQKMQELVNTNSDYYMSKQFENVANVDIHRKTTGPEIFEALGGEIDYFVAGVGTGGTISGVGEYLKSKDENIKVIAVEPAESAVLSGDKSGTHGIQGIGAGFVPSILDEKIIDKIMKISTNEAIDYSKLLMKTEGISCGISSGAALAAAINLASLEENTDKNIVVLLPDTAERYLSTNLFPNETTETKYPDDTKIICALDNLRRLLFPQYLNPKMDMKTTLDILNSEVKKVNSNFNMEDFSKKLLNVKETLTIDLESAYKNDPAVSDLAEIVLAYPGFYAIFVHRVANLLASLGVELIPRIMSEHAHTLTGIDIHPKATIDSGFFIDHGTGVVIGETTIIKKNVRIFQGVTLGAISSRKPDSTSNSKRHPTIEDNVIIYANAVILGGKTIIGENSIIGANTFITKSIKPNTVVKRQIKVEM